MTYENKKIEPTIFPNPTTGELNLKNFKTDYYSTFISDITGKVVYSGIIMDHEKIDISFLLPGLYFITFNSNLNENYQFKLLKID
jgi:hypothetical protein